MSLQEEIFKTYSLRLEQTSEELKRQGEFVRELFQSRYYPHVRGYTNPSVLEIGCNKGFMTRAVGAFFPTSDIVGIDMSPDDIRFAQNTCTPPEKGTLRFSCVDFFDFTKSTEKYDIIICKDVMEHIAKDRQWEFVQTLYDILNDNGTALIQVPNMDWIFSNHERYMDFTHEIGYTRESFYDVFRVVFGKGNIEVVPASYVFKSTLKQKIVYGCLRPVLLKFLQFIFKVLGEGAHDVWFEHREILAVARKSKPKQ